MILHRVWPAFQGDWMHGPGSEAAEPARGNRRTASQAASSGGRDSHYTSDTTRTDCPSRGTATTASTPSHLGPGAATRPGLLPARGRSLFHMSLGFKFGCEPPVTSVATLWSVYHHRWSLTGARLGGEPPASTVAASRSEPRAAAEVGGMRAWP
jgi:hypothetical protein